MGRVSKFKKIKAIDPFYKGKRKSDEHEHNDPPQFNVLRAQAQERRTKQREAAEQKRQKRLANETKELEQYKGLSRKERKESKIKENADKKKTKLKMAPVSTMSTMDTGEFVPLFAGVPTESKSQKRSRNKKKKSKANSTSDSNNNGAAPIDITALVNKKMMAAQTDVDFGKQFAIQQALQTKEKGKKKKAILQQLAEEVETNPMKVAETTKPSKPFVDADDLTRKMLADVKLARAKGEKFFDYSARVNAEVAQVFDKAKRKQHVAKKKSKLQAYREKKKKRKDAKSLAKTKEIDADTDEQIELIPFGESAQAPPKLPELPARLKKRKLQQLLHAEPTASQVMAAAAKGLPLIESKGGSLADTRASIIGQKKRRLVGASSLSLDDYAQEVRDSYRALKARRRRQEN